MNALMASSPPTPHFAAPDIVRRFLAWAQRAEAEDRAEAASALARAYFHSDLAPSLRAEAVVALTALLDDPSALVRRALAEALASAREAPRHLALALANDQSEVSAVVLARSPILTDAELVDCAAIGDVVAQCAIARRPNLGAGPAAALAEIGKRDAALALIGNLDADLPAGALRRFFERFGDDAEAREALLARPSLPASLRADIAIATAKALSESTKELLSRGRAERIAREAREQTIASIAANCSSEERAELARSLRERGALTLALLLRAMLSGGSELFAAALAELARIPHSRVAAFMRNPRGEGFAALVRRAGLPSHTLTVFRAALAALETYRGARGDGLKPALVEKVIAACEAHNDPALAKILSLLWRFAAEAARADARRFAREATAGARTPRLSISLDLLLAANDERVEPPMLAVGFDSASARANTPEMEAAHDKPDGNAASRIELPKDAFAEFEQVANDEGCGSPLLTAVRVDSYGASAQASDLCATLEEPNGAAASRATLSIDFLAQCNEAGHGETPSLSLDFAVTGAVADAPDFGGALDERVEGGSPTIQPPIGGVAGLERAA